MSIARRFAIWRRRRGMRHRRWQHWGALQWWAMKARVQRDIAQRLALDDLAAYDDACAGRPTQVADRG